jgi:ABC-type transport system substrate-binding protein
MPPPTAGSPPPTRGRISKDGEQLKFAIGVAANDPTSVAVANTAADQLRSVGIAASVLALDPPTLYGDALAQNRVDAIVGWHQAGGDLATALASRFGCPALEATAVSTAPSSGAPRSGPSASSTPTTTTSPSTSSATPTATTPPSPPPPAGPDQLVQAPSNLTGICDRSIQPNIDAALDGSQSIGDVLRAVEPRLWNMSTVLPILQDTTIVAAAPNVQNVSLSGAVPVGIVGDAGKWVKGPQ